MKSHKYKFRKYKLIYPKLFEKEKKRILKIIPNAKIEHIGSTSIPGLGGKGIIDIAIRIPKGKIKYFLRKLKKLSYSQTEGHSPTKNSVFTQKVINTKGKEKRMHVHLVLNNPFWNTFIAFREYMKKNPDKIREYEKIKKEAVNFAKGDGKKYRDYKNGFLEGITKKAIEELK